MHRLEGAATTLVEPMAGPTSPSARRGAAAAGGGGARGAAEAMREGLEAG